MNLVACCLVAALAFQVETAPNCDLKTIFRTPNTRRNYDQFEILERSNFDSSSESTTKDNNGENGGRNSNNPNSFANAQVMLRFGSDNNERRPCNCNRNQCQCPSYYYPSPFPQCFCLPLPYYYPQYPYYSSQFQLAQAGTKPSLTSPTSDEKSSTSVKPIYDQNGDDTTTPTIVASTQPSELNLKLIPNEAGLTNGPFGQHFTNDDITTPITEPTEPSTSLSPNLEMVTIDFTQVNKEETPSTTISSGQKALNDALVEYTSSSTGPVTFPTTTTKKLLTFPIFNKPNSNQPSRLDNINGQFNRIMLPSASPGLGYYSSGSRQQAVFYREPAEVLSIVKSPAALPVYYPRQVLMPEYRRGSYSRYVCVPVPSSPAGGFYGYLPRRRSDAGEVVVEHREEEEQDCCCPGCRAKYVGELNEMGL